MSTPLPDAVSVLLRTSATAAIGALLLISVSHRELFSWAARMIGTDEPPPAKGESPPRPHGNGAHEAKARKPKPPAARKSAGAAYHARQRKARDRDDQALLEAMRSAPDALIRDWAEAIGKGRSSVVSALKRLRAAGLAESFEGKWRLSASDSPPPKETPKWTSPLRGADRAAHPHLT
jgi:hypothetical protein